MSANKTVTATFTQTPPTYDVTAQVVNSPGGSVTPASRTGITSGSTTTFTVTTNSGYTASVSEGSLSGTTWTTDPVTSSHTATVTFTLNTYTVTASVVTSAGGSVSPASRTGVSHGSTTTFTVTTSSGYTASVSEGSLSGATWTTAPVTSSHTATITFTQQPVTPSGTTWVWDTYPMFYLNQGEGKVFIVNINRQLIYLDMSIAGLNMGTEGSYTWTFPDGSVYPQVSNQGQRYISGMNQGGSLALLSKKYYWGCNLNLDYIPQGNHVLTITGGANSSYFKIKIDAY